MKANLVINGDTKNVTIVVNGEMYVADNTHPKWDEILQGVSNGDENVINLIDLVQQVKNYFEKLSDRVAVHNGQILFDGDVIDNALTDQILRFIEAKEEDFMPLVLFFEKISDNPNPHSREQLYSWLSDRKFTITSNGDFIAYKGVAKENDQYVSVNSGTAVSNGVVYTGKIPNPVGAVVEMPRSKVEFDSQIGCSYGLHAGTYEYAKDWAKAALLEVIINPRDVVSVPTDCDAQKIRVCRYKVLGVAEAFDENVVRKLPEDEFDDYFWPEDDII